MNAILQMTAVTRVHGEGATEVQALRSIAFAAYAGELVAVMGPSGSGKSTLLTLAGLPLTDDLDGTWSGTITLDADIGDLTYIIWFNDTSNNHLKGTGQTVTVTDNCTETSNLTITQDPAPGTALVPGRYDITLTAVDSSGNSSSCTVACSVEDRAFLRGNVNDRRAHRLDVMDLVELIHLLFGGRTLAFDCEAALDVNDDGVHAIADVLALAQSMFQSTTYEIPEPSSVPSLVVPDGGDIPSILSCNEGEICQ